MVTILDRTFTGTLSHDIDDYPEGVVIPVDKDYRWTSADVIRKIKFAAIRHFGKKNLKVGHAGTLDPLATGLLLVCIGNACKKAEELQRSDKEYLAELCFGATTPSFDREKDVDRLYPTDKVSREKLEAILPRFIGEQDQTAPLFSAKQVDGVRAYEIARKMLREGKAPAEEEKSVLNISRIRIDSIELLDWAESPCETGKDAGEDRAISNAEGSGASSRINVAALPSGHPLATLRIRCSKGTYIRALARDIGQALDSGAFLSQLRRCASGSFRADNALGVSEALSFLK